MPDYSYKCLRIHVANKPKRADLDQHGRIVRICRFQCEDEHGHMLAVERGVVVSDGETADIERYAENILREDEDEATFESVQRQCRRAPRYDFYNPEAVAAALARPNADEGHWLEV